MTKTTHSGLKPTSTRNYLRNSFSSRCLLVARSGLKLGLADGVELYFTNRQKKKRGCNGDFCHEKIYCIYE
jgi:hypothetical protein